VPKTKKYKMLSEWCYDQRNNLNSNVLSEYRKNLLDKNKFIWNVRQYRFKKKIKDLKIFVLQNNRYPTARSSDKYEKSLAYFVCDERREKRDEKTTCYPQWKLDIIIQDGLDDFFDDRFDKLNDREFKLYIEFLESICEREDLFGFSIHMLDIFRKGNEYDYE